MDARNKSLEELHAEYIALNKKIMGDPLQPSAERERARRKVNQYLGAMKMLYGV